MKLKVALMATAIALAMFFAQVGRAEDAATPATAATEHSNLVQKVGSGEVDWGKQMMYATAEAPISARETSPRWRRLPGF
jgi:hypothetical protein